MYRITIPEWTDKRTGEYRPQKSYNARLVETLLANSPQPSELIFKYYGNDAPASVFKPSTVDRLVFEKVEFNIPTREYIIIPNTSFNQHMWAKL